MPAEAAPAATRRVSDASPVSPGHGEFFYIKRHGSAQVLDVFGDSSAPGTRVIAYPRKPSGLNQQWQFVPAEVEPGWWYRQTAMPSKLVMTLQDGLLPRPQIVMEEIDPLRKQLQLWNLVPTRELGWWFIQSKSLIRGVEVDTKNPNSIVPTVIGIDEESTTGDVFGVPLDFRASEPLAWGFMRLQ